MRHEDAIRDSVNDIIRTHANAINDEVRLLPQMKDRMIGSTVVLTAQMPDGVARFSGSVMRHTDFSETHSVQQTYPAK